MAVLLAYWHKEGLEVYRYEGKKLVKVASGNLDELKPFSRTVAKKILVVGRELLFYTRKRYPPAPVKKLTKAVGIEIGALFPISKPAFQCKVYESSSAYTTLSIWAWETEEYGWLRKVFPFNYVVPEDLACTSDIPEVKVFQYRGIIHMLAHSGEQFLGGASYPDSGLNEGDVERFLSGLGRHKADIKQVKEYGSIPFSFKDAEIQEISRVTQGDYPPCMDYVAGLDLNEFKVKREVHFPSNINLLFRVSIYVVLGYALMLFLTAKNYEQSAGELRKKMNSIGQKISLKDTGQKGPDYSEAVKEVNEKLTAHPSPLEVMRMVANRLPLGSFILRMVLNENNLELSVSSKEPISVVKALGDAEGVRAARLKGSPMKDIATGIYNFVITLELTR